MPAQENPQDSIQSLISPARFEERTHVTEEQMDSVIKRHSISFKNAFNGIKIAFRTQPNFRFHVMAFILVNVLALYFKISVTEFIVLLVMSTMVFLAEMANTAVEALGDEIAKGEYRQLIGIAKDVAAGSVLVSAIGAVLVALVIFVPRIINLTQPFFSSL